MSVEGIKSATVLENYPEKGINTVLCDDGTGDENLSGDLKEKIENIINGDENNPGYRAAGIEFLVQGPQKIKITMDVTVYRRPLKTLSDEALKKLVKDSISRYINTRKIGEDVVLSACISTARAAHPDVWDITIDSVKKNNEEISLEGKKITIDGIYIARTQVDLDSTIKVDIIIQNEG